MRKIKNETASNKSKYKAYCIAMATCLAGLGGVPATFAQGLKAQPGITMIVESLSRLDAIDLIATQAGVQPLVHVPISGEVSLALKNSSFEDALDKVLGNTNATYMVEGNRLHIFQARETWNKIEAEQPMMGLPTSGGVGLAALKEEEPIVSQIVQLTKRSSADIQKLVKDLDAKISCVFDTPTNSLIIKGPKSQVAEAVQLCNDIDNMIVTQETKQAALERSLYVTKDYLLEHADFEEIETELENIIERSSGSSSSSSSSSSSKVDKDGNPIETEYFLIDKARRVVIVHTTEQKLRVIDRYFTAIDNPLPQVLIEAQIVSVKDGFNKKLGIDWSAIGSYHGPATAWSTGKNGHNNSSVPFEYGKWDLRALSATLEANKNEGDVKILSRPRILAISGKEASIHVGDELPYVTSQTQTDGGSTTQNVEYKQVGVKLDVTPTVNFSKGTILMKLAPEVSEELEPVIINGNRVPVITTRRAESTIEVKNGETMVIGGLLKDEENINESKVPGFSKIPGLGKLFTSKVHKKEKTNLMILLTPRIITNDYEAKLTNIATTEFNKKAPEVTAKLANPIVDLPSVIDYEPIIEEDPIDESRAITKVEEVLQKAPSKAPVVIQAPSQSISNPDSKLKSREYLERRLAEIKATTRQLGKK
jgi:type II secretory pathway component GspD/PulD (secretin)